MKDLLGLVNTYCSIKQIEVVNKDNKIAKVYYPAERVFEVCGKLLDDWELVDLTDEGKKKEFLDAVLKAYETLKQTEVLSNTPPRVLARIIDDFRALETIMLNAGFDENFWRGIELA